MFNVNTLTVDIRKEDKKKPSKLSMRLKFKRNYEFTKFNMINSIFEHLHSN